MAKLSLALSATLERWGAGEGELFSLPAIRGLKSLLPNEAVQAPEVQLQDEKKMAFGCLLTASPHLQFTVNYHFLFNNPVITL